MNALRYAWDVVLSDPTTLAAALMMAAALLALILIVTPARPSAAARRRARPAEARTMAAAGRPTAEIARRTGLSRDAIAIVLAGTSVPQARKARPVAASFSVPHGGTGGGDEQRATL